MTKRRSRGDGGLFWDEKRQRWIASVTVGYDGRGKRVFRRASGRTKTEAKDKLKEIQRAYDDGMVTAATGYTVGDALTYWLAYGLNGRDPHTVEMYRTYAETHIIPAIGKRKLRADGRRCREAPRGEVRNLEHPIASDHPLDP
jgi:hypothetical protein